MIWAGLVARIGERRGIYRLLVGEPEVKRPFGRTRRTWEDRIEMNMQEVRWGSWTGLLWLRKGAGSGLLSTRQ
jgi:hypothetical protein